MLETQERAKQTKIHFSYETFILVLGTDKRTKQINKVYMCHGVVGIVGKRKGREKNQR